MMKLLADECPEHLTQCLYETADPGGPAVMVSEPGTRHAEQRMLLAARMDAICRQVELTGKPELWPQS